MACERYQLPDGGIAIVCTRGKRRPPCSVCGRRGSELLCDGVVPGRKRTCDAPLCRGCAQSGGAGVDFCPACAALVIARAPPTYQGAEHYDEPPQYLTLLTGSTTLVERPGGEAWARHLVHCFVDFAETVVVADAPGPGTWALEEVQRLAEQGLNRPLRCAVYRLDGTIRDLEGATIGRWAKPAEVPSSKAPHWRSWPMTRDSAMVRAVATRARQGRPTAVEVLHDPAEPQGATSALVTVGFARNAQLNPLVHTFSEAPPAREGVGG